jgi:tetratricopeptide (TPR) repeat protein
VRGLALCVILSCATTAWAENDFSVDARASYEEGTRFYAVGDFAQALAAFRRAYLHYDSPALLYNIARCHANLNNHAEALRFLKIYLELVPYAPIATRFAASWRS